MEIYYQEIKVSTKERIELVDITDNVQNVLNSYKIKEGLCFLFTPHTTTGLIINENEKGLIIDLKNKLQELVPIEKDYHHNIIDNNAHAHISSSFFLKSSVFIPIIESNLYLGTWQRIFLFELDGPRTRKVLVMVIGRSPE